MPLTASNLLTPELMTDLTFATAPSTAEISDDEARVAQWCAARLFDRRGGLILSGLYFDGLQDVTTLGIAIPPELSKLRAVLGWPGTGVEAVAERLSPQGFRMPSSVETDDELWDIWQANNLVEESGLAHLDALIYGTSYVVVGPRAGGGQPVITIESPMDMTAVWDPRQRRTTTAFQTYLDTDPTSEFYGHQRAALYLPNATIHLVRGEKGWTVIDRDDHRMDVVPVVPMANRERTADRVGRSEINHAWRNTVDRASRNMVAMEVAREFFAAPQRYILGATESAFQKADGTAKSAWETYVGRILALEPDERGNLPTVGEFNPGNPEAFTKLYDVDVRIMAGLMGVAPQYLGIYSDGNPASADAIRMADFHLKTKADKKAVTFGSRWEQVLRIALLVRDGGLPPDAHRMQTDWGPTGIPTPAADTDAVVKQIAQGMVPAESDVALERVGYSAVERSRIQIEQAAARAAADRAARVENARLRAQQQTAQQMPPGDDAEPVPGAER